METFGTTALGSLVVRPITAGERERFDATLEVSHWHGAGLVGEVMRYVAEQDSEWCALLGFGSAALCVRSREDLLSWSDAQRFHRLRYITNNQRLQSGADIATTALWLGHENLDSTGIYVHADMTLKERAPARTTPVNTTPERFRASDTLLTFFDGL